MECVSNFFTGIRDDLRIIEKKEDSDQEMRNARISSVALRIIAAILLVYSVCAAISAIVTIGSAPLTGLGLLISAIIVFVLTHDLIVFGTNSSHEMNDYNKRNGRVGDNVISRTFNRVVGALSTSYKEGRALWKDTPHLLEGTWVMGPMNRCFRSLQSSLRNHRNNSTAPV